MAKAPAHVRITWSGVFGTRVAPVEIFSHGLSCTIVDLASATDVVLEGVLTEATQELQNSIGSLLGLTSSGVHWTNVRMALVGADGLVMKTSNGAFKQKDQTISTLSGTVNFAYPYQVSSAVTCRTAVDQPWGRGRFFLPGPVPAIDVATGLITETAKNDLQTACDTFVTSVDTIAAAGWGGSAAVASGGSVLRGVAPAVRPITAVSVGRVLDTMRTRRNALPELYGSASPI